MAEAYRELARSERERWLVVDATGDEAEILATLLAAVKALPRATVTFTETKT